MEGGDCKIYCPQKFFFFTAFYYDFIGLTFHKNNSNLIVILYNIIGDCKSIYRQLSYPLKFMSKVNKQL